MLSSVCQLTTTNWHAPLFLCALITTTWHIPKSVYLPIIMIIADRLMRPRLHRASHAKSRHRQTECRDRCRAPCVPCQTTPACSCSDLHTNTHTQSLIYFSTASACEQMHGAHIGLAILTSCAGGCHNMPPPCAPEDSSLQALLPVTSLPLFRAREVTF